MKKKQRKKIINQDDLYMSNIQKIEISSNKEKIVAYISYFFLLSIQSLSQLTGIFIITF